MDNPYQPPLADVAVATPALTGARKLRQQHIQHEASIRSFGLLFLLGGGVVFLGGGAGLVAGLASMGSGPAVAPAELAIFVVLVLLGGGQLAAGVAMRRLHPRSRVPGSLLAGVTLLNFPVGTLIGGYILYLLNSEKGRTILSPAYAEVRAQTADMRPRTSTAAWVFLGVLVLALLAMLLGGLLAV